MGSALYFFNFPASCLHIACRIWLDLTHAHNWVPPRASSPITGRVERFIEDNESDSETDMQDRTVAYFSGAALLLLLLSGCGGLFEDNGTHLAHAIEKEATKLRESSASEMVVQYETLDGGSDPYYVEITPSFPEGRASSVPGSYLVVSGRTPGGTSYHNRFVLVPQRLYIKKEHGGPTYLVLRRDGDGVSVVELR